MTQIIIPKYPQHSQEQLTSAANTWRLPYWDWAVMKSDARRRSIYNVPKIVRMKIFGSGALKDLLVLKIPCTDSADNRWVLTGSPQLRMCPVFCSWHMFSSPHHEHVTETRHGYQQAITLPALARGRKVFIRLEHHHSLYRTTPALTDPRLTRPPRLNALPDRLRRRASPPRPYPVPLFRIRDAALGTSVAHAESSATSTSIHHDRLRHGRIRVQATRDPNRHSLMVRP